MHKNLSQKYSPKNYSPELIWNYYAHILNLDLNKNVLYKLNIETDLKTKTYYPTHFNNNIIPKWSKSKIYFTKDNLKSYYFKDYRKYKKLEKLEQGNLFEDNFNYSELKRYLPYKFQRINYSLLNYNNYACKIKPFKNKQGQFVYRLDIDLHDQNFINETGLDTKELYKDLIKIINRKCNVLLSEISVLGTGCHIYIGMNQKGSYDSNLANLKTYFNNILNWFINSYLDYPELNNKLTLDIPSSKILFALPLNSVYEWFDIKSNKLKSNIDFYKEFLKPYCNKELAVNSLGEDYYKFPNLIKKKKYVSLNNINKVIEKQNRLLTKVKPTQNIESTGWEKEKGLNDNWYFYDSNLTITDGLRVQNTKLLINKMLSINHLYTEDQFNQIIKEHIVTSKDIRKWSVNQLERDLKAWYSYYEKMWNQNSINSIKPQNFYSNISVIPNNIGNKLGKIAHNLITREYKDNPFKTKESFNQDLIDTELILKEIVGYSIYISQNKSKIKSNVKLTNDLKEKAESNLNLGREWLKALKEHYGLESNVERLFKLILDKSGLFNKKYYGNKSYLNLKEIKIATTFNYKIKLAVNQIGNTLEFVLNKIKENLDLVVDRFKGSNIKYSIMCDGGYSYNTINPILKLMLIDDTG